MHDLAGKTVKATIMHAPRSDGVEILPDALITVDVSGTIETVLPHGEPGHAEALQTARTSNTLVETGHKSYLLPGFVDLHIHAPQWPQLGKALDVPLEVWLQTYTFPLEARYADTAFARRIYDNLVSSLLAHGTTTAVYFATIHQEATRILAETCLARGQRALIGKVAMDNPDQCPDYYRDVDTQAALDGTRAFIEYVRALPGNEGWFVRWSRRVSFQAARMRRLPGWVRSPRIISAMSRPTVPKATGSMDMSWSGPEGPTRLHSTASDCLDGKVSWRIPIF